MSDTQWERHTGGSSAKWVLRCYLREGSRPYSIVLGSARKATKKHRCRMWVVTYLAAYHYEHLATLRDMKQPEALDTARLLIMLRHDARYES